MASRWVLRNASCLITNAGVVSKRGRHIQEKDVGAIANAALAFSNGVVWVGPDKELPKTFKKWKQIQAKGLTVYPGLVDAHTHPVFSGDRSREFEFRMKGATYQEIATAGGGIATTVEQTRASSTAMLEKKLLQRIENAFSFGVRLLEAKSGYGLNAASEFRSLEAIRRSTKKQSNVRLISTCMAAHAVPKEHKGNRGAYLSEIHQNILPSVAKKKLATYVDVFCDEGYFSVTETKGIIQQAHSLGLYSRVHGEELAHTGVTEQAVSWGVHSVDHLLKVSDVGIRALATSETAAILLPGTSFYLKEQPAPARKLIDSGALVVLATDFNPGSCPTQNLPWIGSIAAISLGMTTAEIIASITWNAARSLRQENQFGALLPGFLGFPAFCEGDHPSALFYHLAQCSLPNPVYSSPTGMSRTR